MRHIPGPGVAVVIFVWSAAATAEPGIKDVHIGNVLHGPPVAADQLEGSVVFVEEWGIH